MSVRVHQLSKKIGMDNKELLRLLSERGFEVKSASSTIDNISAESLVEEFAPKPVAEETIEAPSEPKKDLPNESSAPVLPLDSFVKSQEDINQLRKEKAGNVAKLSPAVQAELKDKTVPASNDSSVSKSPLPATVPAVNSDFYASAKPPLSSPPSAPVAGPPKPPAVPKVPAAQDTLDTQDAADELNEEDSEAIILHVKPPIVVRDFAVEIGLKPFKLISELMEMGIFASMNQTIEETTAVAVAKQHGFSLEIHHRGEQSESSAPKKVEKKVDVDDPKFLKERPPVVCILGHVDHGKTTLLDTIRQANVTASEAGGITQHIGAYQIEHNSQNITFIDTPGHAAFSMMRARGANVTDISVLVIAADDAFKPQTEEALKFAQQANNAIVVAINKIDAKGANVDRVKQQMQEKGIAPEDWGGETVTVEVSAINGTNIDNLLDMILLQAEVMELKANPDCSASGIVVESQIEQGRGATASVIIEKGTLKKGDSLLCGEVYCRVKSLLDDKGKQLKSAPPGAPVRVLGWSGVPASGDHFTTEKNEKLAKRAAEEVIYERKRELNAKQDNHEDSTSGGPTVDDLFAAIEKQQKKCLRLIVKSDVHGSAEALANAILDLQSDKIDLDIIHVGVGNITKNDVTLASASDCCIIGFNVRLDNGVQNVAKHHDIRIIQHEIIYELLDKVEEEMVGMLDAELSENKTGAAEVRQVFPMGKGRYVAGCMVTEGTINRSHKARLVRAGEVIHESNVDTLRRFKDDVKEVRAGYECGINVDGYDDYQEGDVIECISVEEIRPSLR